MGGANIRLKYPRRKKRRIAGKIYDLTPPDSQRSTTMSRIRSRNTSIEVLLAKAMRQNRIRYRSGRRLYGKPDFRILGEKVVIFCDGDFWHGYNLEKNKRIRRNAEFWKAKIRRNVTRDREVNRVLRKREWKVLRFWEHQIKKDVHSCIKRIKHALQDR